MHVSRWRSKHSVTRACDGLLAGLHACCGTDGPGEQCVKCNTAVTEGPVLRFHLWELSRLKFIETESKLKIGRAAQQCEWTYYCRAVHLKMIKVVNFVISFIYSFLERGEEEKEREIKINVWLPLMHLLLGTWPTTQACALTGNRTGDPLVRSPCSIHRATAARA